MPENIVFVLNAGVWVSFGEQVNEADAGLLYFLSAVPQVMAAAFGIFAGLLAGRIQANRPRMQSIVLELCRMAKGWLDLRGSLDRAAEILAECGNFQDFIDVAKTRSAEDTVAAGRRLLDQFGVESADLHLPGFTDGLHELQRLLTLEEESHKRIRHGLWPSIAAIGLSLVALPFSGMLIGLAGRFGLPFFLVLRAGLVLVILCCAGAGLYFIAKTVVADVELPKSAVSISSADNNPSTS